MKKKSNTKLIVLATIIGVIVAKLLWNYLEPEDDIFEED
jgi:hypothetical protein